MLDCDKGESSRFPLNLSFRVSKCRLKLYSTNIAIDPGSTEEGSAADSYDPILGSDKIESTPIGEDVGYSRLFSGWEESRESITLERADRLIDGTFLYCERLTVTSSYWYRGL